MKLPVFPEGQIVEPNSAVLNYLNGAGNHELENLLGSIFLTYPNTSFSASGMAGELISRQGDNPAWKINPQAVASYCIKSLKPIGMVVSDTLYDEKGNLIDVWQAEAEDVELKLAISGFLSDWGLRWDKFSVQQVLGRSQSTSHIRCPQSRFTIFQAIRASGGSISLEGIYESTREQGYPLSETAIWKHIDTLSDVGVLIETGNRGKDHDTEVRVVDNKFSSIWHKEADLTPETRAVYLALGRLPVEATLGLNELVELSGAENTDLDLRKIRARLINGVMMQNGFPGLAIEDNGGIALGDQSVVRLTVEAEEPINELVNGVVAIELSRVRKHYAGFARRLLKNKSDFKRLVQKADSFSTARDRVPRAEFLLRLEGIINSLSSAKVGEVRTRYRDEYGKQITSSHIKYGLNVLAGSDRIGAEMVPHSNQDAKKSNLYFSV